VQAVESTLAPWQGRMIRSRLSGDAFHRHLRLTTGVQRCAPAWWSGAAVKSDQMDQIDPVDQSKPRRFKYVGDL